MRENCIRARARAYANIYKYIEIKARRNSPSRRRVNGRRYCFSSLKFVWTIKATEQLMAIPDDVRLSFFEMFLTRFRCGNRNRNPELSSIVYGDAAKIRDLRKDARRATGATVRTPAKRTP